MALLALAVVARVAYLQVLATHGFAMGEIANAAISFAQTGVIADAFRAGQGPTAHVLPLPPVYAGLIYRALGVRSAAAEGMLAASAIGVTVAGFALLYAIFGLLGTARWARLAALAFLAVLPLNMALETIEFRIWDSGVAVLLALGYLYLLLRLERAERIGFGAVAGMSIGAAVVLFVSPALGLGAYAGSLVLLVDRVPPREWPRAVVAAVVALVVVLAPWTLRNMSALDAPVFLRSNAGLEFALANHPAAVSGNDQRRVFRARLEEIHPFESDAAYAAMKAAGGEVPYAKALGAKAWAWAKAHPADFARLTLRHLQQFLFPPAWLWNIYSDHGIGGGAKLALSWAVSAAGVAGALVAAVVATRRYRFAVLMALLPILPYVVTQPVLRYRYIVFGLLVFFSFDLASRVWRLISRREPAAGDRRAASSPAARASPYRG